LTKRGYESRAIKMLLIGGRVAGRASPVSTVADTQLDMTPWRWADRRRIIGQWLARVLPKEGTPCRRS